MKKILAIAPYPYLPYFSGGQKFIAQFYKYLSEQVNLTVITVPGTDATDAGYPVIPLLKPGFNRYYDRSLVRKITNLILEQKFDAVIWEHPYFAWLANAIKKRTGIRTIIHTHNIEYQRFRSTGKWWWPLLKMYEKWAFKKADHLLFITEEDLDFATKKWKIAADKCTELPFGVETRKYPANRKEAGYIIRQKHNIASDEKIILFNGLLNYKPNTDALIAILDEINPQLQKRNDLRYRILICGKGLPSTFGNLEAYKQANVLYAGFVEDIDQYFCGADLFLNPVQSGGGIKTKMVEAIGFGLTVIASQTGAMGMRTEFCGEKLKVIPDNDWAAFSEAIRMALAADQITPETFYTFYNWKSIINRLLSRDVF